MYRSLLTPSLGCRAIELGKLREGGVIHAVVYEAARTAWVGGCFLPSPDVICEELRDMLPSTTVYIYISRSPGAVSHARLLDNEEGASVNTERYVFGKLSASCFQTSTFMAPALL